MKKRLLAALLSLIMVVSLLPLAVTADGTTTPSDVIYGHYDENNKWVKDKDGNGTTSSTNIDGVKSVSKTAEPSKDKDGNIISNRYDVTLEVVLETTTETTTGAATVLVVDTSGSMDYCSVCGYPFNSGYTHNHGGFNSYYDVKRNVTYYVKNSNGQYIEVNYCDGKHFSGNCSGGPGWYTGDFRYEHTPAEKLTPKTSADDTSGTQFYVFVRSQNVSRISDAKEAAIEFLKSYSGFENFDTNNIPTDKSTATNRYVSLVRFATGVSVATSPDWVDVSTITGYRTVKSAIENLKPDGATNLDAGLRYADYLLGISPVANLSVKNTIVLTDGKPTYCLEESRRGSITIGNKSYQLVNDDGDGMECSRTEYITTKNTATTLKDNGKVSLYTVCFGASNETIKEYDNPQSVWYGTTYPDITVGKFLETKIATPATADKTYAYNANNSSELIGAFKDITESIVSGISAGTVTDSLPDGIDVKGTGFDKTWELKPDDAYSKVTEGNKTTYTYRKTYTVTIDPDEVKADADGYAPLNGDTTLEVKAGDETKEIKFPIPAGKVTPKKYTLTYIVDGVQNGSTEDHVANADVTLRTIDVEDGYHFDGWYTDEEMTIEADEPFKMPAENTTLYGKTVANTDTAYTVVHYQQNIYDDGYTLYETETDLTGTTGELTNAQAKAYTGFTAQPFDQQTIKGDGTTVVEIYYNRNTYKVTYEYTNTVDGASPLPVDDKDYRYGATVTVAAKATAEGYDFDGWKKDGAITKSFEITDNVTLTGTFTEKGDTPYKIEHWVEDGATYILKETEPKSGKTNATVTASAKSYDGFTFDANNVNNVLSGEIKADGSLVLKLYYTRNKYTVKYEYTNTVDGASELPAEATYKYEADVKVADKATAKGYIFNGWKAYDSNGEVNLAIDSNGMFKMPAYDVVFKGGFEKTPEEDPEITVTVPLVKAIGTDAPSSDIMNDRFEYEITFVLNECDAEKPFNVIYNGETLKLTALSEDDIKALGYSADYIKEHRTTAYSVKANVGIGTSELKVVGNLSAVECVRNIMFKENLTPDQVAKGWSVVSQSGIYVKLECGAGITSERYNVLGLIVPTDENEKSYFGVNSGVGISFVAFAAENKYSPVPADNDKKVTLPHWVKLKYMDGNDQLKRKAYIYDDLAKLNFVPTREGYTFTGWYTDSSCTVKITQIRMKGDIKVYAGWEKNEK